jgi:hypothetical protein
MTDGPDHRAESDAGVVFGEDGYSVIDPDGRVIVLVPMLIGDRYFGTVPVFLEDIYDE